MKDGSDKTKTTVKEIPVPLASETARVAGQEKWVRGAVSLYCYDLCIYHKWVRGAVSLYCYVYIISGCAGR
jgi:hypothetical protein